MLSTPTFGGKDVDSQALTMGRAVARKGDRCSCPVQGHQDCTIAEGDAAFIVAGQPAAFDGHTTTCGAVLISSAPASGKS
ncbi:PAAR domain-containing protein [Ralstonia pseudosolanacearum]|uniref:PAAR domain-containing protein n=1 Tax=Ralstonia pseudosolanacearum TaxID=1310165 RepID=UPI0026747CC6|nr:PAAR domain-containing protein [Ralstonia pseudosolanacearum]MDO3515043.1 PAAR domain-containing protein [Ralstonia pseudosolanacearum]MDO3539819.1 PAAR domain-containing protein [Ralstonia pseudosolanacearum]MDO3608735.1 PAAR domain-containing protein [Ralstonia pseudosolanacearum]MDO3613989.1 PAAR domain-containing protein [Ralstonia pseudosolanacearum]MDO3633750.1 PAAR domain-containing protein [Ralstonia pseudosolanacearum]